MAVAEYELIPPPSDPRGRELWIQHAAGFILIEDVYRAALSQLPPDLTEKERAVAEAAARKTLYCLMQVIEGVTGGLQNRSERVEVDMTVTYSKADASGEYAPVDRLSLQEGDGVCMAVHGWLENDFGEDPVASKRE